MSDDIDALQSPENGKTCKVDRAATAIGLVLEAPEYGWAAATSVPTLPTAESMPASAPQTFPADIPALAAHAFGDRTAIAAEVKTPVDRPGAVRQPASETSTNETDEAAAREAPDYPEHPYAKIIPPIVGQAFDILIADTKRFGQREPIYLHEGKVLGGRDQLRACREAGVRPAFEIYEGDNPLGFLINRTVGRIYLDETQRALVAARVEELGHGGDRKSVQGANLLDRSTAAKMLNVSKRSVTSAAKVLKSGEPKLVQAVEQGKISVSVAAAAADLTPEHQEAVAAAALANDKKTVLATIKALRGSRESRESKQPAELASVDERATVIVTNLNLSYERRAREADFEPSTIGAVSLEPDRKDITKRITTAGTANCVLFAAVKSRHLAQALDLMKSCDYQCVSSCVWLKDGEGADAWFREAHEFILVGVRGIIPPPASEMLLPSVIGGPAGEDSGLPEELFELIERYFPNLSKKDLDQRGPAREGWVDRADRSMTHHPIPSGEDDS